VGVGGIRLRRVVPLPPDPERGLPFRADFGPLWRTANANMSLAPNKSRVRSGTRVSCEIPTILTSLGQAHPFSGPCLIVLVNPQGCAARFGQPLEIGASVRLEGLPTRTSVTARVVNCIPIGEYERFWLLGLALDEPGNVWGVQTPPQDWGRFSAIPIDPVKGF